MGISASRWWNRGWTMQEDFMATRLLVFQEQTVTWECLTKAEQEDTRDSPVANVDEADANTRSSRDFMSRYWKRIMGASNMSKKRAEDLNLTTPSGFFNRPMSMWYKTIEEYSDRRLTQVSDRLPALSGLAALLQQVTGDEYCARLWKNDLLRGLLWCYQPSRGDPSKVMEMFTTNFEDLSSKLDTVYFTDHLKVSHNGPSWSWVSLEGTLKRDGQESCPQFGGNVVMPVTRIVDVHVDLVVKSNHFGRVFGGRLSIEAAHVSWKEGQTSVANLTKFVSELVAQPNTSFTAEYQLRHQPYQGQVTAVLLIDCNTIQGRAILVESVQISTTIEDQLYRRVGRFDIKSPQPYDSPNHIGPAQSAAYEDCARGLPVKTFVIL